MKKAFYKISTTLFALLVLIASMGFTLNKHYCGGELQEVAINADVEPCPMCKTREEMPACHDTGDENNACCENEQDKIETSEFNTAKKAEKQLITDFQLIAFTYVLFENIHTSDIESKSYYKDYTPPLIDHDIPVEVQSFLL